MRSVVQLLDFHPHSRRSMEIFLVELARHLREKGWRTVHVVSGEPGDFFRDESAALDSPYLIARFPLSLGEACKLGYELRRYSPDIIHTAFVSKFDPLLWTLKRCSRTRRLVIGDHSSGKGPRSGGARRAFARARAAIAGLYIDHVVAVSEFVKQRNIETVLLPEHKIRTIYNGVEQRLPAPKITNEVATIAFAGQLIPQKGVQVLLRAIKELTEQNTAPFRVLIAGQGPYRDELSRYCEANGLTQVEFLGQIDWVPKLYETADIVVAPSQWEEACAFSIIEAMSCGACLVVSDAGGNPELVGEGGTAGLVFERANAKELAARLRELLRDPPRRQSMATTARNRATELFSLNRMVSEYVEAYENIAAETRSGAFANAGCARAVRTRKAEDDDR